MERSMSLVDLPSAWLLLLSTHLTSETAARARCTCKLMQKMIDQTWEPEEVPLPPHRRSVPLTLEQLQAQLPPQKPWKNHWFDTQAGAGEATTGSSNSNSSSSSSSRSSSEDNDDDESSEDDDECWKYDEFGRRKDVLSALGPALTCLTANQVINKLQGKPMLCCLRCPYGQIPPSKYDTVHERMSLVQEVTFSNIPHKWPPVDRYIMYEDCQSCKGPDSGCKGFSFFGSCLTPKSLQEPNHRGYCRYDDEPYQVFIYPLGQTIHTSVTGLLATTEASFQPVTERQEFCFCGGDAASDADCFDWLLAFGRNEAPVYVFLDPMRRRFTGRLRTTTAA